MGHSSDLHFSCRSLTDLATLRLRYPNAALDPSAHFACVHVSNDVRFSTDSVLELAGQFSRQVIYLAFSSVTDSLQFTHCDPGKLRRHLQHGMFVEQGLWEEVEGEPEPWEHAAFFAEMPDIEPQDFEIKQQVEAIYNRGKVAAGDTLHLIDARESARAAALFHGLTGWQ